MSFDVVLLSAFQRADWLACELKKKGYKVALCDVSHLLKENFEEPPFGYFSSRDLSSSQLEFLEYGVRTQKHNFRILTEEGPFLAQSSLTNFWVSEMGMKKSWDYLCEYESCDLEKQKSKTKKLQESQFQFSWLAHLSHRLSASFYDETYSSFEREPLVFSESWCVRQRDIRFESKSFCEKHEVLVLEPEDKPSSFKIRKAVKMIQFPSLGELKGSRMIVSLVQHELEELGLSTSEFCQRTKPILVWSKMSVSAPSWNPLWGDQGLWLLERDFSWTHENLCVIQNLGDRLELWVRLPYCYKFQDYDKRRLDIEKKILLKFCERFCMKDVKVLEGLKLILSLSIYETGTKISKKTPHKIWWDSPEVSGKLDWQGRMLNQQKILKEMKL